MNILQDTEMHFYFCLQMVPSISVAMMYVIEVGCLLLSVLGVFGACKGKRWCLILVKKKKIKTPFVFLNLCLWRNNCCIQRPVCLCAVRSRDGGGQSNNNYPNGTELPRCLWGTTFKSHVFAYFANIFFRALSVFRNVLSARSPSCWPWCRSLRRTKPTGRCYIISKRK